MRRMRLAAWVAGTAAMLTAPAGAGAAAPLVSTGAATAIARTAATVHGSVDPRRLPTTYAFQYGLTRSYGLTTRLRSAGSGGVAVAVAARLRSLAPGTIYHYRLVATSASGVRTGADHRLETAGPALPGALTGAAVSVTQSSATLTGVLATHLAATTYHFRWGPTTAYGALTPDSPPVQANVPLPAAATITGLQAGATFHYQLVAANASGTTLGNDQTFTTLPLVRARPGLRVRARSGHAGAGHRTVTVTGTLVPAGFPPAAGCHGVVGVALGRPRGGPALATRRAVLTPQCTFAVQARVRAGAAGRSRRLRVRVRFHGNRYLTPRSRQTGARLR